VITYAKRNPLVGQGRVNLSEVLIIATWPGRSRECGQRRFMAAPEGLQKSSKLLTSGLTPPTAISIGGRERGKCYLPIKFCTRGGHTK
jgi:hypothetical protein